MLTVAFWGEGGGGGGANIAGGFKSRVNHLCVFFELNVKCVLKRKEKSEKREIRWFNSGEYKLNQRYPRTSRELFGKEQQQQPKKKGKKGQVGTEQQQSDV